MFAAGGIECARSETEGSGAAEARASDEGEVNMDDGPEWFAPKRYGYGAGSPISWQGWAIAIGFVILAALLGITFARKPLVLIAIMIPLTVLFSTIAAKTTRGGWRWRWGEKD
jgi:hypothetical protein